MEYYDIIKSKLREHTSTYEINKIEIKKHNRYDTFEKLEPRNIQDAIMLREVVNYLAQTFGYGPNDYTATNLRRITDKARNKIDEKMRKKGLYIEI